MIKHYWSTLKDEKMYKILTNKEFTEETHTSFKRVEPHKKSNAQWRTVSKDLAEFMREEMMCPKDVADIHVSRKDDN